VAEGRAQGVLVQLADDLAAGADPLGGLHCVLERGQRLRLWPDDPAGQAAGHEGPGDLQHLPVTVGDNQADAGALALEHRVGGDRRAVHEMADGGGVDGRRLAHLLEAGEHADRRVGRRGGRLGPVGLAGVLVDEQQVRERAAHVYSQSVCHVRLLRRRMAC
jgi:hypothetical protein